jgi:hypothetical protein
MSLTKHVVHLINIVEEVALLHLVVEEELHSSVMHQVVAVHFLTTSNHFYPGRSQCSSCNT